MAPSTRFICVALACVFLAVSLEPAAAAGRALHANSCKGLEKRECKKADDCTWDKNAKECLDMSDGDKDSGDDDKDVKCSKIDSKKACKKADACKWDKEAEECMDMSNDDKDGGDDDKDVKCSKIDSKKACRKADDCTWDKEAEECLDMSNGDGGDGGDNNAKCDKLDRKYCKKTSACVWARSTSKCYDVYDPKDADGKLDPKRAPSRNFDLRFWKLTLNDSKEIKDDLSESPYEKEGQFFTGSDGAMVFRNPSADGKPTSSGTKYTRVELREMLRGSENWWKANGDGGKYPKTFDYRNNWVWGSASSSKKKIAGGVNGVMEAVLKVDRVSTTTRIEDYKVGRIVIGQVHSRGDEPIRLYYHKIPGNKYGGIYYAHEPTNKKPEQWINLIGNYVEEGASGGRTIPFDEISDKSGIELGEEFGYKIEIDDDDLIVEIYDKKGKKIASDKYDMSGSGYDDMWTYFKAGCYSQNVATKSNDYDQVSFYKLDVTHENMKS